MEDLIRRQGAIDLIRDVCDAILSQCGSHCDGDDEVYDDPLEVDAVLKCNKQLRIALANMPSAQERKKGRWITDVAFYDEEGCPCIVTRCDQCGEVAEMTAYCPHCGSRMEGTEE